MSKNIFLLLSYLLLICSFGIAREHPYFVNGIAASPDGRYVAIGRLDDKIILFDLQGKRILKEIGGKPGEISDQIFFSSDGKYFVYQYQTLDLLFFDLEKQEVLKQITIDDAATGLAVFKDDKKLIWGGKGGKIEFINLETNERKTLKKPDPYSGFPKTIRDIVLSPDEKRFVSVTYVNADDDIMVEPGGDFGPNWNRKETLVKHIGINLWDAEALTKIKKLQAKDTSGKAWATFSPDSKYVFTSYEGGRRGTVHQWDAKGGELVRWFDYREGQGQCVSVLESSGKWIAGFTGSLLLISDTQDRVAMTKTRFNREPVFAQMTTVPSKNLIITGDTDGSISVYKFNPETLTIELIWHPEPVKSGIITWVSPLKMMYKSEEEARKMQKDYIERQKKMGYGDGENPPNGKTAPTSSDGSKDSSYPGVSFSPELEAN